MGSVSPLYYGYIIIRGVNIPSYRIIISLYLGGMIMKRRNPRISYSTEASVWCCGLYLDEMMEVLKVYHNVLRVCPETSIYVDITEDREYETREHECTYTLRFFRCESGINGVYDKDKLLDSTECIMDELAELEKAISEKLNI